MNQPYISVVITAHNRKEFLRTAVESVLHQSADRGSYEIIVVKNFLDEQIDPFLDQNGVVRIFSEEENFGRKLSIGIENSKGEIVSFLDDDDLFHSEKLRIIEEMFKKYPALDYYHNSIETINPSGNVMQKNITTNPPKLLLINEDRNRKTIRDALRFRGDWYSSAISIRKSAFIKHIDFLKDATASMDRLFFYIVLLKGRRLAVDPLVLTSYRVHPSTTTIVDSFEIFVEKKRDFFTRSRNSIGSIMKLSTEDVSAEFIRCAHLHAKMNLFLFSDNKEDKVSISDAFKFLKCAIFNGSRYDFLWFITAIARRLFPSFTKRIYYHYMLRTFRRYNA